LSTVIKGGTDALRQCSLEAFSNGAKFAPVDAGVSCGLDTGSGRQFVVEASKGGLSVELFLPLKA
jgi:tRNA 2-selenouridine synthase SelU